MVLRIPTRNYATKLWCIEFFLSNAGKWRILIKFGLFIQCFYHNLWKSLLSIFQDLNSCSSKRMINISDIEIDDAIFELNNNSSDTQLCFVRRLILISCSISFASLSLVLLLFTIISELRTTKYARYWIMLCLTALIHHASFILMRRIRITNKELFDELLDKYHNYIYCLYFIMEFSLYMWLNVICYDIFVSLK